jgi:hypothetical protein
MIKKPFPTSELSTSPTQNNLSVMSVSNLCNTQYHNTVLISPTLNNVSRLSIRPQVSPESRIRISINTKSFSKPSTPKYEYALALRFITKISGGLMAD